MSKHCGNCAVYDRKNMKHSKLCGKCVTEHFPNGKESDPSMWRPLPQTKADRIRSMDDEELAWELMTWRIETEAKHHGIESNYPNTQKAILEWLRQPVLPNIDNPQNDGKGE